MVRCEHRDMPEPVKLLGCVLVHCRDLPDPVQDWSHHLKYAEVLENVTRISLSEEIIINSFLELEEGAIKALQVEEPGKLPDRTAYPNRPKANEIGKVEREEIARVVKELMEGEEGKKVREKMKGLQDATENVLNKDGSSANSLSELAFRWKN
ncbi:hypothetical protein RHMOL_Rhmol07G0040800 [Rhododendron molle]|uniref:Uncharacterized protein n=1 Tax=Rhododendron molle TaxID=49168 RepID=A0ACC0MXV0_RHOML|nr:hypothetical protein RHMOL_Rhmol07G0040800 [Rhododendron molle]